MTTNRSGALRVAGRRALCAAAWTAGWLAAAWGLDRIHGPAGDRHAPAMHLLAETFQLPDVPHALMAPWFFGAIAFAGLATLLAEILLGWIEPYGDSARALRWSLRTLPCLLGWCCVLSAFAVPAVLLDHDPATAWFGAMTLMFFFGGLIQSIVLPFVCYRGDVVARERPPWFWKPRWPGLAPVLLALAPLALNLLPDSNFPKESMRTPLQEAEAVALLLVFWPVGSAIEAWFASAWLRRWKWPQIWAAAKRPAMLWPKARRLMALDVRLPVWAVLVVAPVLPFVDAFWDLEGAYLVHHARGVDFHDHPILRALVSVERFAASYWSMGLMFAMPVVGYWILWMSRARALHLADATEEPGHARPDAAAPG